MTKTVLLTLGRLPKALELARGFKRAGWRVVIAEPFSWHVSRLSKSVDLSLAVTAPAEHGQRYLDDNLRVIRKHSIDLIDARVGRKYARGRSAWAVAGGRVDVCTLARNASQPARQVRLYKARSKLWPPRAGNLRGSECGGLRTRALRRPRHQASVLVLGQGRARSQVSKFELLHSQLLQTASHVLDHF